MTAFEELIYTTIGKRIKEIREADNLTQEQLATAIKVSRASLANYESGKQAIYISDLFRLAIHLRLEIVDLLPSVKEIEEKSSPEILLEKADIPSEGKEALAAFMKKAQDKEET